MEMFAVGFGGKSCPGRRKSSRRGVGGDDFEAAFQPQPFGDSDALGMGFGWSRPVVRVWKSGNCWKNEEWLEKKKTEENLGK